MNCNINQVKEVEKKKTCFKKNKKNKKNKKERVLA